MQIQRVAKPIITGNLKVQPSYVMGGINLMLITLHQRR